MFLILAQQERAVSPDSIVRGIAAFNSSYPALGILLALMGIDILMGLGAAFKTKQVSSAASFNGMLKKSGMLLFLSAAAVLEPYTDGLMPSKLVATLFILTEVLSIVENAKRLGVPIPKAITEALANFKKGTPVSPTTNQQNVTIDHASSVNIATPADGSSSGIHVN